MKIAYWSSSRNSGVTGSMLAVALAGVLIYPSIQITLFENHYSTYGIAGRIFSRPIAGRVAEASLYYHTGGHISEKALRADLPKYCDAGGRMGVEVIRDSLYYVPQLSANPDMFDYEFRCDVMPVLEQFSRKDKIAFIDTKRGNSISSKLILEDADIVVVILKQSLQEIQEFIQNYSSLIPKTFFILGNYERNYRHDVCSICREFDIKRDNIGAVPHLDEYEQAMAGGRTVEYIVSNFVGAKSGREHYFMQELKKTTFLLFQRAIFPMERELDER